MEARTKEVTLSAVFEAVRRHLPSRVPTSTVRRMVRGALGSTGVTASTTTIDRSCLDEAFMRRMTTTLTRHAVSRGEREACLSQLRRLASDGAEAESEWRVEILREGDVMLARSVARSMAAATGFDHRDSIRIVTSVSEIARNIYRYARPGHVIMRTIERPRPGVEIEGIDRGPGIPHLDQVLAGLYQSETGMGLGLLGCKRLMDEFEIQTGGKGTRIRIVKFRS